ncbi:MAG TPA: hypothetical protein VFV64_00975 [Permianibacter sp.]|nr:hypothetical protein [Permianibacter sp.]
MASADPATNARTATGRLADNTAHALAEGLKNNDFISNDFTAITHLILFIALAL